MAITEQLTIYFSSFCTRILSISSCSLSYLSIAYDDGRQLPRRGGLHDHPGVDRRGKNIPEVVDDAGDEAEDGHQDQEDPEATPEDLVGQGVVAEAVGWRPQAEALKMQYGLDFLQSL